MVEADVNEGMGSRDDERLGRNLIGKALLVLEDDPEKARLVGRRLEAEVGKLLAPAGAGP